jgi:hypothetical protein
MTTNDKGKKLPTRNDGNYISNRGDIKENKLETP